MQEKREQETGESWRVFFMQNKKMRKIVGEKDIFCVRKCYFFNRWKTIFLKPGIFFFQTAEINPWTTMDLNG